jgi:hypothetical protein
MIFTISDVVARAGVGDPWERAEEVTTADPATITAAATGFAAASGHARAAVVAAERADAITAESHLVDRVAVHDAPAATAATRNALGDGGEHPERIARMLASVAADLVTTQGHVQAALTALEQQLNTITATSPGLDPAAAERALFDQAVTAVRTHGGTIAAELDAYDRVLAAHASMLADLSYDPPTDPDPIGEDSSPALEALDALGALADAALHDPQTVVGLLAGAGLVSVGATAVLAGGAVTVGSGGTLAVGGVPTVAAGVGLVGVGGALVVASVDRLTSAAAQAEARRSADRKAPSVNQAQKEVERGKAPKSIDRFDKGHPQLREQPHVHFKDGNALNQDGTWKHGPGRQLTNDEKDFLTDFGWQAPK